MLLTLFAVALVLEVLGLTASIKEYRDGRERWRHLFYPPAAEPPRPNGRRRIGTGTATWNPHEPADMEERVAALEQRLNWYVRSIRTDIGRVEKSIPAKAQHAATQVEERLAPQVLSLVAYLAGQYGERPRWLPVWWTGPALLVAGVLLGFVANVMSVSWR